MKKRLSLFTAVAVAAGCVAAGPLMAADTASFDKRIQELEAQLKKQEELRQELVQQLDGLRQQYLKDREDLAKSEVEKKAKATTTAVVTANDKDGFSIKSGDGNYKIKLSGLVQTDARIFTQNNDIPKGDTARSRDSFVLRSARPTLSGSLGSLVDYTFSPEFGSATGGTTSNLPDAYVDLKFAPEVKFRAGKTKAAYGLDRLQSSSTMTFVETALPSNLMPNRELGFGFFGDLFRETLSYSAGIYNGGRDAASADNTNETNEDKEFIGRVFAQPFKNDKDSVLKGLGFGIATTYGDRDTNDTLPTYKTTGQNTIFTLPAPVTGTSPKAGFTYDGEQSRYSPQLYYYYKNFGFMGEYAVSQMELKDSGTKISKEYEFTGWQAAASYVLTGEAASYKGISPAKPFDWSKGDWGAFEIAARYSELALDDDIFKATAYKANGTYFSHEADAFALAFNWYLNKNVRYLMTYENTAFDGCNTSGKKDVPDENVAIGRVEVKF